MEEQIIFDFEKVCRFDMEDFFEDNTNEEALNWLMHWPNWPGGKLNIYGDYSCGKSHLASLWLKYVGGYRICDTKSNARDLLSGNKHFLIDPFEEFINLANADKWLFDFINVCSEKLGSLLIVSRTIDFTERTNLSDLVSRLNAISHVKILPPSDDLLKQISKKISADLGVHLKDNVVDYIVNHACRNVETVSSIIEQLNALSLKNKRPVDVKMVRSLLETQ